MFEVTVKIHNLHNGCAVENQRLVELKEEPSHGAMLCALCLAIQQPSKRSQFIFIHRVHPRASGEHAGNRAMHSRLVGPSAYLA